jgi:6-pyruvoyl-tetrahydropterin synthase
MGQLTTLFYKQLTVLDIGRFDRVHGPMGESYWVNVELTGTLDDEGMLLDFSKCKKLIKSEIDAQVDHRFVLPKGIDIVESGDQVRFELLFGRENKIDYQAPAESIVATELSHIDDVTLSSYLEQILLKALPSQIKQVKVNLVSEQFENHSWFHYTHGLKFHEGNCQRIFHGHKNTLEVRVNGERSRHWEKFLAHEVFKGNVHFCTIENLVDQQKALSHLPDGKNWGRVDGLDELEINYKSSQGETRVKLPGHMVFLIPVETTVENLAHFFAMTVSEMVPPHTQVEVKAFEGISKGAYSVI